MPDNLELNELSPLEDSCADFKFGAYLRNVRRAKKISIRQFAKAIGKTPTYLSDIENGNNKPPDKILLETIITQLQINDHPTIKNTLFDLAAKERNDIPADIKEYIINTPSLLGVLRSLKDQPNNNQFWHDILQKL